MKAVTFLQANFNLAEGQSEYITLPSYAVLDVEGNLATDPATGELLDPEVRVVSCFELSDEEIAELVRTKKLWHIRLTFGSAYQPMRMSTLNPFENHGNDVAR